MAKKQYWHNQEIIFLTEHFGKPYFYLKDGDGTIYIAKAKPVYEGSVDGGTGETVRFVSGYEPDLA